jgi:hypothetical protein
MASHQRNLQNRTWLLERLRVEVIGPDPSGEPFEPKADGITFLTWEEYRKPKRQKNGEEILWQDPPIKRYGAGIVFPLGLTELKQMAEEAASTPETLEDTDPGPDIRVDEIQEKKVHEDASKIKILADETEDYDVTLANAYRPSAMGLSFLADFTAEAEGFSVRVECAHYAQVKVKVGYSREAEKLSDRELWFRIPCFDQEGNSPTLYFTSEEILNTAAPLKRWVPGYEQRLEIVAVSRIHGQTNAAQQRLITICLVNRQQKDAGRVDELCFFQCGFHVRGQSSNQWILPYPEVRRTVRRDDDEEEIIRLLYRDRLTFAIGHGCAADWPGERPDTVGEIATDCMPTFETPGTSADLMHVNGDPIRVSMRKLAGLDPQDDGGDELARLLRAYRDWIHGLDDLDARRLPVPEDLRGTATLLTERCKQCLSRIEDGISFLQSNSSAARHARDAFRMANHAMLVAQLRASREVRLPQWQDGRLVWDKEIDNPDPALPHPTKGYWRAFQIAFLLMTVRGICEPTHQDRSLVDLIWFPTGGGKTEAYLGLTAFTIFYNRLAALEPTGADVIMRYTLRLLTTQQFQRAGLLFCAMEHVRRLPKNFERLGDKPFRLGMWVGGDATPNTRADARAALSRLQRNPDSENPFVLLKCPWCNAKFGPMPDESSRQKGRRRGQRSPLSVLGYSNYLLAGRTAETVVFRCNDQKCEFGYTPARPSCSPHPICIIDEDIFEAPPNLIIGTVDKFAMLAWKPEARTMFGIGPEGKHTGLPPTLIIQDELHLISGPLGSMVGAYETVVEEICTRRSHDAVLSPKIVASTATISRAEEQVKALYGRHRVMLFPPSGLEAGDSFFAREARSGDGTLKPGRLYTGIMAPGHGSLQTTLARVYAALLQYTAIMPVLGGDESERDPWWTLLSFFNSLRELGGAATLLVADARDYLRVIIDRHGFPYSQIRQLLNVEELTSRIRSDKIPLAIQKLEIPFGRDGRGYVKDTVEACLASNIIEVGIDIDRLSLMTIVGQPKTTSQYIQVSSRIGRSQEAPGLVVVAYSQSKPRDRSHYERFRSYHQRLYAQVEPTSVTPFSPPAVDRTLHGIIVAAVRQLSPLAEARSPRPFPLESGTVLRSLIENMIEQRITAVDPAERSNVWQKMLQRLNEWKAWDPAEYGGFGGPPVNPPLLHPAGSRELVEWNGHSWATVNSLRDVDATCEAEITGYYNEIGQEAPS